MNGKQKKTIELPTQTKKSTKVSCKRGVTSSGSPWLADTVPSDSKLRPGRDYVLTQLFVAYHIKQDNYEREGVCVGIHVYASAGVYLCVKVCSSVDAQHISRKRVVGSRPASLWNDA
ncbi:hypothetical protein C0Q70_13725 [Pomacea canaliculata]|uniref:Uncharacterized protein n=1 Tax=Pomacea canaliculata TaxID=400727 RepID=A0A2T7NY01_POMCA|nr:hypothetical protein C0Q70_13725 [Pomacea canaliculata]